MQRIELWQRSFNELSQIEANKGVERKRKKRQTKAELVALYQNKKGVKMPEYNTSVTYDPKRETVYEIVGVDEITTRNNLLGIRVGLKSYDKNDQRDYGVTLWPASETNATSKWGSFVAVLGSNTDSWLHKWIKIVSWQNRLCEIALMPVPKMSLKEAALRSGAKEVK